MPACAPITKNARLLHRLDAQTGGVLLAALEEKTYQSGLTAFREHQLVKTYRAVAKGPFPAKAGESRDYLSKDARRATVRVVKHPGGGAKPIITRWRVLEELGENRFLVELEPVTGRTHQLRAHMAFYGHPILGMINTALAKRAPRACTCGAAASRRSRARWAITRGASSPPRSRIGEGI